MAYWHLIQFQELARPAGKAELGVVWLNEFGISQFQEWPTLALLFIQCECSGCYGSLEHLYAFTCANVRPYSIPVRTIARDCITNETD